MKKRTDLIYLSDLRAYLETRLDVLDFKTDLDLIEPDKKALKDILKEIDKWESGNSAFYESLKNLYKTKGLLKKIDDTIEVFKGGEK